MGLRLGAFLAVIALGGLALTITAPFFLLPIAVPLFAPIVPRPASIPRDAAAEYDFKSGKSFVWTRTLAHGCAAWQAKPEYASVTLSLDRNDCRRGPGVSYLTFEDNLVFGVGDESFLVGGNACPFSLAEAEMAERRRLIDEALAKATTAAEKAVLERMLVRFAKANGRGLTSNAGGGCNDLKLEDYKRPVRDDVDVWQTRSAPTQDARS